MKTTQDRFFLSVTSRLYNTPPISYTIIKGSNFQAADVENSAFIIFRRRGCLKQSAQNEILCALRVSVS